VRIKLSPKTAAIIAIKLIFMVNLFQGKEKEAFKNYPIL
jgi:hypothetical protein